MVSVIRKGKINICKLVLGGLATNAYIVYSEQGEGFIVDPAADAEIIKIKVTDLGLTIKGILLTHGHFDHIGAVKTVKELYNTEVYACDKEKEILENSYNNLSEIFGNGFTQKADEYLPDGYEFELAGFDIKLINTPGHTVGGACYLVSKDDEKVLISGDTLFAGSHGRYDFPTGNYRELITSIKEKLLVLDENLEVYPGHNEETTIGEEKVYY